MITKSETFPRVVRETLPEPLSAHLGAIEKRLGYLNELFLLQSHVPASVESFMAYTQAVKAPLSDRQNELVALAACAVLHAEAELIQHERLALRLGLDKAFVAAAEGREGADAAALTPDEHLLRSVVCELIQNMGRGCEPALARLAGAIGAGPAMAVLLQSTRFIMIGVWGHVFEVKLPVPSIFEEGIA
jgi:Carboxymuconolactone decarboxylase family